ncbi:hypothetical protein ACQJBY_051043 [Aegilops geniculata]
MDALTPTRRRRLLAGAAAATACYGLYRLYLHHRRRIAAALSLADALSQAGSDLADFLRSDSDQVPRSLRQLSKLAASDHVSSAASALSESLASGALRAFSSHRAPDPSSPPLQDRILDRLLSPAGAGFASAVLGSFARNLVLSCRDPEASPRAPGQPDWLAALCSDRGKEAAAELVRVFVSTAVAAYLDRTAAVRTSDQVLAGVTDPNKHDAKLKDLLVSVCNGAVETFVRTSRQVTNEASISRAEAAVAAREVCNSGPSCVMERVSTTLAMPGNRRFVLDVTGRVTAEMVRSFLEFSTQRVSAGARKSIVVARDEITERGLVAVKYLSAKSMAIFTLCLTMCMHISVGMRFPLPA